MASAPSKPLFIDPTGDASQGSLPVRPPFLFSGVTSRVFPLKANMARLTQFCDSYVNMDIPAEIVHYRPALPYVYLMVLDYGSMSSASMSAQNVGWVAQHEVAFTVPLERWKLENGTLVFQDWACVSPFIFVDDELSLTTGREIYGWPKVSGRVDAIRPMWDRHPTAGSRLFSFSTSVFPKVYAGEAETDRVLLQIDTDPAAQFSTVPPSGANPWAPWSALAQATRSSLSLVGSALDMTLALRSRGYRTNRNRQSLRAMGSKAADYLVHLGPTWLQSPIDRQQAKGKTGVGCPPLAFDNVTIKQFRDAQEPSRACYKALVRSTMGIERINSSGLLGDANLLRGDTSGGYSIRVHRYASQPIIESLGIEVAATENGDGEVPIAVLKPTFPFWTDVDLYYGAGEVICSRTHLPLATDGKDELWQDEQPAAGPPAPPAPPAPSVVAEVAGVAPAAERVAEQLGDKVADPASGAAAAARQSEQAHNDYNTALGAATQPMVGPFHFPDVTLQVYPLLADRVKLDHFVEQYLNETMKGSGQKFATMGSYAYLLVQCTGDQNGTMWSSANNIGWWAEREVSLCVPVKWYSVNPKTHALELVSVAMVAPFVYSSNGRAVITDREVNGRPSVKATISSPRDVWLGESGPDQPRQYLRLDTELFPALGYGQKAEERTLLEIDGRDVLAYNDSVGWRLVAERWGPQLVDDLMVKAEICDRQSEHVQAAKALALEVLGHGTPINWLVLKQHRDAAEVDKACYQALVCTTRSITRIYDIREIEDRVHVRVHRSVGHPLVETLGLKVKSVDSTGNGVVANLQPLRPFWMRISAQEDLGRVVAVHKGDGSWQVQAPWAGAAPNDADPAHNAAVAEPYFRARGWTQVSPQWDLAPQQLRSQVARELRNALYASLQAAAVTLRQVPQAQRNQVRDQLEQLYWTAKSPARKLLSDLQQAEREGAVATFAEARSVADLQRLEQALLGAGLDWKTANPDEQRLTVKDAQVHIAKLQDMQVVLETILNAEWENWGNPRWYQDRTRCREGLEALDPMPTHRVPAYSLQGGLEAYAPCTTATGLKPELAATRDGAWFYVERPETPSGG